VAPDVHTLRRRKGGDVPLWGKRAIRGERGVKAKLIDWSERLFLLAIYVAFVRANLAAPDVINWLTIALETVTALFVLTRRSAISVSENPADWAFAIMGSFLPLALRPGGEPILGFMSLPLISMGILFSVFAKISLNRRFGIMPANRGVQSAWAYSVVRHPMYFGYFLTQTAYLLHNPTPLNIALMALCWGLQFARILREENHLMLDEAYRTYAARVRRRLIPGVY